MEFPLRRDREPARCRDRHPCVALGSPAGQAFKGILRLHFLFALAAILGMWATVWVRYARKVRYEEDGRVSILVFDWCVCLLLAVAGHLGGFLIGVNGAR